MKILCTFPGKIGDAIWSLPTVRAISRYFSQPVDFCMSKKYGQEGLMKLIQEQEYIAKAFVLDSWEITDEQHHMIPREPKVEGYDKVFHLGYKGWPSCELAEYIFSWTVVEYWELGMRQMKLDMSPWIVAPEISHHKLPSYGFEKSTVFVGWNQEWLELKMGLVAALSQSIPMEQLKQVVVYGKGMRHEEWQFCLSSFAGVRMLDGDFYYAAAVLTHSAFYLGDLSAQWVLACAMGKPCVVMEPSEARWNPIFWWDGEGRNRIVRGGDGKPTFDARHVADAVREELKKCGF